MGCKDHNDQRKGVTQSHEYQQLAISVNAKTYEVQSRSNAYIFIVTVQELLLQPR